MEQIWKTYFCSIRTFMLGLLWAVLTTMGPVVIFVWDSVSHYDDPVDWTQAMRLALAGAAAGVTGYWRKHKALLQPPPGVLPEEPTSEPAKE